jgi:uroporphyrinogen-III synthase
MSKSSSSPAPLLAGRRVVVTRTRDQAGELRRRLEALGAEVLELPLIRVSAEVNAERCAEVFAEMGSYEWIVFTSANGVRFFFAEFFERFRDIRSVGLARFAAVGPTTARALSELHLEVEVMPQKFVGEALVEALLAHQTMDSVRVLVVTGSRNRDVVVDGLHQARAIVDQLAVYRTEAIDLTGDPIAGEYRRSGADALLFTSSSGVESFVAQAAALALGPRARRPKLGSIGPITSEAMREFKLPVDFEAREATLDALVTALVAQMERQ